MPYAFQYAIANGGLCSASQYPYSSATGSSGSCSTGCTPVATLSGFVKVASKNDKALAQAVTRGPVAVAVQGDQIVFQFYSSGVIQTGCGAAVNHAVLIVGFGIDSASGLRFWKVQNSWCVRPAS